MSPPKPADLNKKNLILKDLCNKINNKNIKNIKINSLRSIKKIED